MLPQVCLLNPPDNLYTGGGDGNGFFQGGAHAGDVSDRCLIPSHDGNARPFYVRHLKKEEERLASVCAPTLVQATLRGFFWAGGGASPPVFWWPALLQGFDVSDTREYFYTYDDRLETRSNGYGYPMNALRQKCAGSVAENKPFRDFFLYSSWAGRPWYGPMVRMPLHMSCT